ncbi:MAG: EAL domain-containing protein [Rhodoferax sp.]|uniref:putative bifunctional diguanylate cyclase/phosphodiesterase n=1 Tax=Rhodoferax sp. TaxID=50421 RepID=UPI00262D7229|nr:EAL domain-containing protein [Rhodoferax sp.]MDD2881860.1 EAL domain-containing protein [Rhodoferax sp.]
MDRDRNRFTRQLWLAIGLFVLLTASFAVYTWSEKRIDHANDLRHQSFLLADELRQSSDDLTRLARTYVATGDPRFLAAYQTVLAIRDGRQARPQGYQNVYWDLVLANPPLPTAIDPAVALLDLMRQTGFTATELALMAQAKTNSDQLAFIETKAMALLEGKGLDARLAHQQATAMLYDETYHQAKAEIMQPIKDVYSLMSERTQHAVEFAQTQALVFRAIVIVFALALLTLLWRGNKLLQVTLGGEVDEVFGHISRIGQGDLDTPIQVEQGNQDSVLGWLAKTQASLKSAELGRQQAMARQQESEAHLRTIIEAEPECIKIIDAHGCLTLMNPAGLAMIEADNLAQVAGKSVQDVIAPEYREAFEQLHQRVLAGESMHLEFEVIGLNGGRRWLETHAVPMQEHGQTVQLAVSRDITERKQSEEARRVAANAIETLAFYDPLTSLPNRRLLMDRLDQALNTSSRHARKSALLFVDLDNFKTLNDTLGHVQGDLLLTQVAQRLKTCIREGDTLARMGSDEFVVMLEDLKVTTLEAATQAEAVGEKILSVFEPDFALAHGAFHSTSSIGITLFDGEHRETNDQPLKRAELAMFQAKAAGRNRLRFFDAQMQADVSAHAALEADLRQAVYQQQFLLHYQPQVVGAGRLTGAEVLVRWQHPQRGMVSPAEFIPLAETSGLILSIGQWVLETACTQLAIWAAQPAMAHLMVAVNVSPRQFHQPDFVDTVLATLARTQANPKRLKLELTESMLVDDMEGVIAKMSELKAKGVGFSLDDFGTGYSSLAYLKRLPLNQLKIDQGFVRNIVTDPNDAAIAKMVVALAESMGLSVIAEGVELQAQAEFLAHLGCHAYQGYLFSRPLPIAAFEAFAEAQNAMQITL